MDRSPTTDTRQRITNFMEEAGSLLQMITHLLDENEQMRLSTEKTQQEAANLRREIVMLKNELVQERDERDMCTKAMNEAASVINEILVKLRAGETSSRFAREVGTALPDFGSQPGPVSSQSI